MGLSSSMTSVSLFGQERAFFFSIRNVLCHVEIDLSLQVLVQEASAPHTFALSSCIRKTYSRMSISVFAKWRLAVCT